jgi:serine/threonine protein kinase
MTRDDPAAFAPPPAFGPFRVLHQIGIGALGPVFRTYEPTRDRLVAVKLFRLDITPEQAQSLANELARTCDAGLFHPAIVEPIAAGVEGTAAYRAEEYVAAESLDIAIRHYAPAAVDQVLPFITQLASGIDFARAAGVGHGGLHLRDVFVSPEEARASGFGIVESLERVGIRAPVRRPYSAPERIAGGNWSTPADVFSLAAIAYELLTARRPSGTGEQIGALAGASLGVEAEAVQRVLARAMDEDPARRYPTAAALVAELEAAARGRATGVSTPAVVAPVRETRIEQQRPQDSAFESGLPSEAAPERPQHPIPPVATIPVSPLDHDAFAEEEELPDAQPEEPAPPVVPTPLPPPDDADGLRLLHDDHAPMLLDDPDTVPPPDLGISERPIRAAESPMWQYEPPERPASHEMFEPIAERERSRSVIVPVALAFVIGALAGLAGGYALATRAQPDAAQTAHAPTAPNAAATPRQTSEPQRSGRAWSEQSVAQPTSGVPPVPREAAPPSTARAAQPTHGSIKVESIPKNAVVTINGKWRGRTPLTIDDLAFGTHTVRIVQPGYTMARETVKLSKADPSRTLTVQLQRPAAAARGAASTSTARGAAPSSAAHGSAPSTTARGAAPSSTAPSAGRNSSTPEAAASGSLFVASNPAGAQVFVDGRAVGTAPLRIPAVPPGPHVIRLELPEYRIWTTSERVVAGQEKRVTGSLERIP